MRIPPFFLLLLSTTSSFFLAAAAAAVAAPSATESALGALRRDIAQLEGTLHAFPAALGDRAARVHAHQSLLSISTHNNNNNNNNGDEGLAVDVCNGVVEVAGHDQAVKKLTSHWLSLGEAPWTMREDGMREHVVDDDVVAATPPRGGIVDDVVALNEEREAERRAAAEFNMVEHAAAMRNGEHLDRHDDDEEEEGDGAASRTASGLSTWTERRGRTIFDIGKTVLGAGDETTKIQWRLCRALPNEVHAFRLSVIEYCLKDDAKNVRIKSPTPSSSCEFVMRKRLIERESGHDTEAALFESGFDKTVWVVFRASESKGDWLKTNGNFLQKKNTLLGGVASGKVHKGFADALAKLDAKHGLLAEIGGFVNAGRRVVLAGHSLGGAMATVTAVAVTNKFPTAKVDVISFGAPRVGDGEFVQRFNDQVSDSTRIVATVSCNNKRYPDLVATLPPASADQPNDERGAMLAVDSHWSTPKWVKRAKRFVNKAVDKTKKAADDVIDSGRELVDDAVDGTKRMVRQAGKAVASASVDGAKKAVNHLGAWLTDYKHVKGFRAMPCAANFVKDDTCHNSLNIAKAQGVCHTAYRKMILDTELNRWLRERLAEEKLNVPW